VIGLLRSLEAELVRSAPGSAAALRPGLDAISIDGLLSNVPKPVPTEVHDLYSWHDGTEPTWGAVRAELFTTGPMLPLEEATAHRTAFLDQGVDWDPRWLPLFGDEHGYFHAVVCGKGGGALITASFIDLPQFEIEYLSLPQFLESLLRRWRAGVYHATVNGGVDADYRALAAIRRQEDGFDVDVQALVSHLADRDEEVWLRALHRLRSRLYPEAVPGLIMMLGDPDAARTWYVIELLGAIGDPAAVPALEQMTANDADDRLRRHAAKALRAIQSGELT
jgi:hypothetical protein